MKSHQLRLRHTAHAREQLHFSCNLPVWFLSSVLSVFRFFGFSVFRFFQQKFFHLCVHSHQVEHACDHHSLEGIEQTEMECLERFCAVAVERPCRNKCMAFWKTLLRKHDSHILCQKNLSLFAFLSVLPRKAGMTVQRNGPRQNHMIKDLDSKYITISLCTS